MINSKTTYQPKDSIEKSNEFFALLQQLAAMCPEIGELIAVNDYNINIKRFFLVNEVASARDFHKQLTKALEGRLTHLRSFAVRRISS